MRTRPEVRLERFLAALEQDLIEATDEEILAVARELGLKPGMQGSMALHGVTFTLLDPQQYSYSGSQGLTKATPSRGSAIRPRRRPKGDAPSST